MMQGRGTVWSFGYTRPTIPMQLMRHVFGLCCAFCLLVPPCGASVTEQPATPPAVVTPATFSLVTERDPTLTLQGRVHFHPGDDPRWADPAFDDRSWPLVAANGKWDDIGYKGLSGLAWYRFSLVLPADGRSYAALLPPINTAYQVFLDGQLVRTVGRMPPAGVAYVNTYQLVPLPTAAAARSPVLHVALRVWQYPGWTRYRPGGLQAPVTIGPMARQTLQLRLLRFKVRWSYFDWTYLLLLELLGAPVAAALFLSRRTQWEYLWFALLLLGLAASHLMHVATAFAVYPMTVVEDAAFACFAVYLGASLLFYRALLGPWRPIFFRVAALFVGLWLANTWSSGLPNFPISWENLGELILIAPIYGWIIGITSVRAWEKVRDARLLAIPVILMLSTAFAEQVSWTLEVMGHPGFHQFWYRISHFGDIFFTPQDIEETVFLLAMLAILVSRFARTQREQDRTAAELESARSVQQVLVPEELPPTPGLAIHSVYHPAQEVGGDFFQVLPLPSGATLIAVGDVAGKGMPAALTVSLVVGTLRTLAEYTEAPGAILSGLNRRLHGRGAGFTTCLVMRIERDRSALVMGNAGHMPPYCNGVEIDLAPNLPLGVTLATEFVETPLALEAGDHLMLITDGVPEAMHHRELFGFDRTAALARSTAAALAEAACHFGQTDDITVLTIDVEPEADVPARQQLPGYVLT